MKNLWYPPSLADLLCVDIDTQADDTQFQNMLVANQATVDWLGGKLDTGTYLDIVEQTMEEDPIDFVQPTLDLYLPGFDPL